MTNSEPTSVFSGTYPEAGTVKGLLESHGIDAYVINEVVGALLPQMVVAGSQRAVEVLVAAKDADKARELIRVYHAPTEANANPSARPSPVARRPSLKCLDRPTILLILGIAAAVTGRSLYNDQFVKHFRHLRIDGRDAYAGAYPVSSEFAARTSSYRIVYDLEKRPKLIEFLYRGKPRNDEQFCAARIKFHYRVNSETRTFEDERGRPAYCRGIHALRLEMDEKRHVGTWTNLGEDSNRAVEDKFGVARALYKLDEAGRISESTRTNLRGAAITDGAGNGKVSYRYDQNGNTLERENRGPAGSLLEDKAGVAIMRWSYDADGNPIEARYYDAHDRLIRPRSKSAADRTTAAGTAIERRKFNALGDVIEVESFDADGRPKAVENGVAAVQTRIDANGNVVEKKYLGADGHPTTGVADVRWEYDAAGNLRGTESFDAAGKLIEGRRYATATSQFDNFKESAKF